MAVRELSVADLNIKDLMAPGAKPDDVLTKMKQRLNGKTGEQVLTEAKRFRDERAAPWIGPHVWGSCPGLASERSRAVSEPDIAAALPRLAAALRALG
jgi:hypothetical protein